MIDNALNQLERQIFDRIAGLEGSGAAPGTPEGVQLAEDRRRLQAIQALRTQLADPGRAAAIESARAAGEKAGITSVQDGYDETSGQARASAAARGLLGSSRHQITQGRARAALDQGIRGVVTDSYDQAQGIRRGDESRALDIAQGVLAPTGSGDSSMAAILAGNQEQQQAKVLSDQVAGQARAALSQAIGGFIGNAGTGYVNASFDRADRQDRANDTAWYDNGAQGRRPSASRPTSPWSSLFQ